MQMEGTCYAKDLDWRAALALTCVVPLVDDGPLLIQSLRDILQADGDAVTAANGGQKGIEILTEAPGLGASFDAVIKDLGMPYVDGRKVAAAVGAASPNTSVILLAGRGKRMLVEEELPAHVEKILSKPPKGADLRNALAALIAGPSRAA